MGKNSQTENKKSSFLRWLLWWQIDQDELAKQVSEYHSLKITQSIKGQSLLLFIFSACVTTASIAFFNFPIANFIDVFISMLLGYFIYRGHRWAMIGAMLFWSFEKFSLLYDGIQSSSATHSSSNPIIHIIWWTIYMHAFYFAFKVEKLRNKETQSQVAPAVTLEGMVSISPPASQQQAALDEERIYAIIAKELETGVSDKGLWTRLFAECGGDEKQTKVLYIKQHAERLISDERSRLEQATLERATESANALYIKQCAERSRLEQAALERAAESATDSDVKNMDTGTLYNLAYNAYETKDYAKAEIIYSLLLKKFPNSKEVKWAKTFFKFL